MSNEKNKRKTRSNHLSVINNPDYKKDNGVEEISWRKAADVFNNSGSHRSVEDALEELQRIRRKRNND